MNAGEGLWGRPWGRPKHYLSASWRNIDSREDRGKNKTEHKEEGFPIFFLSRLILGLVWAGARAVTHQDKLQSLVGQTKHLQPSGLSRKSTVLVYEYIEASILQKI